MGKEVCAYTRAVVVTSLITVKELVVPVTVTVVEGRLVEARTVVVQRSGVRGRRSLSSRALIASASASRGCSRPCPRLDAALVARALGVLVGLKVSLRSKTVGMTHGMVDVLVRTVVAKAALKIVRVATLVVVVVTGAGITVLVMVRVEEGTVVVPGAKVDVIV